MPASAADAVSAWRTLSRVHGACRSPIWRLVKEAAESRGPYLGEHSRAVARLSHLIGARLELSPEQLRALERGALLHDFGKTGVPEYILSKSGRLNLPLARAWAVERGPGPAAG